MAAELYIGDLSATERRIFLAWHQALDAERDRRGSKLHFYDDAVPILVALALRRVPRSKRVGRMAIVNRLVEFEIGAQRLEDGPAQGSA